MSPNVLLREKGWGRAIDYSYAHSHIEIYKYMIGVSFPPRLACQIFGLILQLSGKSITHCRRIYLTSSSPQIPHPFQAISLRRQCGLSIIGITVLFFNWHENPGFIISLKLSIHSNTVLLSVANRRHNTCFIALIIQHCQCFSLKKILRWLSGH